MLLFAPQGRRDTIDGKFQADGRADGAITSMVQPVLVGQADYHIPFLAADYQCEGDY